MVRKLETVRVDSGIVLKLSPSSVKKKTKSPSLLLSHARFKKKLEKKSFPLLREHAFTYTDKSSFSVNLYDGGINFPDLCPVTLKPASRYEILEIALGKFSKGYALSLDPGLSKKKKDRILTAYFCDRFWYIIPFSENHGIKDRAIHLKYDEELKIFIKNRKYAELFEKSSGLKGRWINGKNIKQRIIGFISGFLFLGISLLFGFELFP